MNYGVLLAQKIVDQPKAIATTYVDFSDNCLYGPEKKLVTTAFVHLGKIE